MSPFLRGLLRGLALRCPRCGVGHMSSSLWTVARMRDACPSCGVTFHPARGEWSGALMFAQGIYFALGLLGVFALLLGDAGLWTVLAWIALSCALLPLLTYRNVKGAWVGAMWGAGPWDSDVVGP